MIILCIALFILWFLLRIYLHKSKHFSFNFHATHHLDVPVTLLWLIWILSGWQVIVFIALYLFIMLDDVIGHWKLAHGMSEKFILEWLTDWLFSKFFKWLK